MTRFKLPDKKQQDDQGRAKRFADFAGMSFPGKEKPDIPFITLNAMLPFKKSITPRFRA